MSHSQAAALRALEGHAGQGLASAVRACKWVGNLGFGQKRGWDMVLPVVGEGRQSWEASEDRQPQYPLQVEPPPSAPRGYRGTPR